MKVVAITIVRDEEVMLPFFLRHYQQLKNYDTEVKFIIYNNESKDNTVKIAEDFHCEVRPLITGGVIRDDLHVYIKSTAYMSEPADWYMVPDVDEFLYHPNMIALLEQYDKESVTLPQTQGYVMYGNFTPQAGLLTDWVKEGAIDNSYSKRIIFKAEAQPVYLPGAHICLCKGRVQHSQQVDIKMLHYKYAFGWDYVKGKVERVRLSAENIANGWGQGNNLAPYREGLEYVMKNKKVVI
jgi:hypothetical protein